MLRDLGLGRFDREVNLYARYERRVVTINFIANNASVTGTMNPQIATYGEGYLLHNNSYKLTDHELSGWATASDAGIFRYVNMDYVDIVIKENPGKDNIDLYAIWAKVEGNEEDDTNTDIIVTYDPNEGYIAGSSEKYRVTVEKGSTFSEVYAERPGYNFRYYRNEDFTPFTKTQKIHKSTEAIAEWDEHTYAVIYKGEKDTTPDHDISGGSHAYNDRFALAGEIFTKDGYTLDAWSVLGTRETYKLQATVSKLTKDDSIKFTGEWDGDTHEIRYVGGSLATGSIAPTPFKYGEITTISDKVFNVTGMVQTGWAYTDRYGKKDVVGVGKDVTIDTKVFPATKSHVELEAIYKDRDNPTGTMFAYVDANGGYFSDGSGSRVYELRYRDIISFAEPSRLGYKFVDYYVGDNVLDDKWTYTTDKDVVASWSAINYTIYFDGNGATKIGTNSIQKAKYGEELRLLENQYEKIGYTFGGWYTNDGRTFEDKATVSNLVYRDGGSVTLKVKWEPLKYTIRYHIDLDKELDGVEESKNYLVTETDVEYGVPHVLDPTLPQEVLALGDNYVLGWSRTAGGSTDYAAGVSIQGDTVYQPVIDLYAVLFRPKYGPIIVVNARGGTINGKYLPPDANGDSQLIGYRYNEGELLLEPNISKKGYILAGWEQAVYVNILGYAFVTEWVDYKFEGIAEGTQQTLVRAVWKQDRYEISYRANNGTDQVSTSSIPFGMTDVFVEDTEWVKTGHKFIGWALNADASVPDVHADEQCVDVIEPLLKEGEKEITLYAVWEPVKVNVTYNANGGEGAMPNQIITYGESERLNDNAFTREGYEFIGWALGSEDKVKFNDKEEADVVIAANGYNDSITLRAVWLEVANTVTIVYKGMNGKVNGANSYVVVATKGYFNEIKPEREGYEFLYYTNEYGDRFTDSTYINISTIAYAQWRENTYRIYFYGNGAHFGSTVDNVDHGYATDEFNLVANGFIKFGYVFRGWDTNPSGNQVVYKNEELVSKLTKEPSINLYAVWEIFTIGSYISSLLFGSTETTYGVSSEMTFGASPKVLETKLPKTTKGHLFGGENISDLTTSFPFTAPTVPFGGSTFWCAEELTKPNYVHQGWKYTRSDGRVVTAKRGDPVTFDLNFLLEYEMVDMTTGAIRDIHTIGLEPWWLGALTSPVYLDSTEGEFSDGSTMKNSYIRYGDNTGKFDLPTRTGYDFEGYKLNDRSTTSIMPATWSYSGLGGKSATLFASWNPYNYTLVYDSNGAGITIAPQIATYDVIHKIATTSMEWTGHTFNGWKLSGTDTLYGSGADVINLTTIKDDVLTFTADWSLRQYTINYHGNGATSGSMASDIATYSVAFKLATNSYVKDGYEFNGWALSTSSKAVYNDTQYIGGSLTDSYTPVLDLYATWIDPDAIRGTILIDGNGGLVNGVSIFRKGYKDGETIGTIVAEKTGYKFVRFATRSGTVVSTLSIPVVCNFDGLISGYAEWGDRIKYNVIYHANDGSGNINDDDKNIEYDTDYRIKGATTFTRDGYDLKGWSHSSRDTSIAYLPGATTSNLSATDGANVHLYAVWDPESYTIVYNSNNTENVISTYSFVYGEGRYIPTSTFSYPGYYFSGWSLSTPSTYDVDYYDGASADEIYINSGRKKVINLYAIWILPSDTINFTFDGNSGTIYGKNALVTRLRVGSKIKYPPALRTGYHYTDWLNSSKTAVFNKATISYAEDGETIYVSWIEGEYDIAYVGHDATGGHMATTSNVPYNTEVRLATNAYVRTGYNFVGWDTSEDAKTVIYADRASVSKLGKHSETVRMYTVWDEKSYNINYIESGVVVATDTLMYYGSRRIKEPTSVPVGQTAYYLSTSSGTRHWSAGETYDVSNFSALTESDKEINFTLYYQVATYNATFKTSKGSFADGSKVKWVDVNYGMPIAYPASPSDGTREFYGWKVDGVRYTDPNYNFNEDKTFVADWYLYPCTVSFIKNEPVSPSGEANVVTGYMADQGFVEDTKQRVDVNAYRLTGYDFIGWATTSYTATEAEAIRDDSARSKLIIKDNDYLTVTGDTRLYAMWGRKKVNVRISQNESYASIPDPFAGDVTLLYDQELSNNAALTRLATRSGYKPFGGKFTFNKIIEPYDRASFSGIEGVDYLTAGSILRDADLTNLYPLWENEAYKVNLDLRGGSLPGAYSTTSVTMYYDAPYFVKSPAGEPRNSDGSLVSPNSSKSSEEFSRWSLDAANRSALSGSALYLDTSITTIYANYSNRPSGNPSGNNRTSGTGGAGGGVPGGKVYEVTFVLQENMPAGEGLGAWLYDAENDRWGYKISTNTDVAKTFVNEKLEGKRFRYLEDGTMQIMNGVYRILYLDNYYYFLFDTYGRMYTGFMITNNGTKHYNINYESLTLNELQYAETAKYYLQETGAYRGIIWNLPITLNGIHYIFDEQGRVIAEYLENIGTMSYIMEQITDYAYDDIDLGASEHGFWEYEPEDDSWMYAEITGEGKKEYVKDKAIAINTYGEKLYYIFDERGKMKTGFTEYGNHTYFLRDRGPLKGALYTGALIYGDTFYNFDEGSGALIAAMTLTQAMNLSQMDPDFAALMVQAMTLTEEP